MFGKGLPLDERILTIRGQKVILDADLAELYGVTTKALNQAIKRNPERFPSDFTFVLSAEEKEQVVTDCDHLLWLLDPPPAPREPPPPEIGFHVKEDALPYRIRRKTTRPR